MKVFKFYPKDKSKFHFGSSHGKVEEIFSSDRLFSALCNCILLLSGLEEGEDKSLAALQNCRISSLYPGIRAFDMKRQEAAEVFFLPRPLLPQEFIENKDLRIHKQEKKVRYISVGALEHLNKVWQGKGKCEFSLADLRIIGGVFACTKEELKTLGLESGPENIKLVNFDSKPRTVISRFDDHTENFFYQEESEVTYLQIGNVQLRPFMYFCIRGEIDSLLLSAIRLMAEEGLGGKRSQGMGHFEEVQEDELPDELFLGEGQHYMNISTVYPKAEELDSLEYYELVERSGYIYSGYGRPFRKKRVRLLREGSIFSKKIEGQVIDIRPKVFDEHSVLLYGKAFLIPLGRCGNGS